MKRFTLAMALGLAAFAAQAADKEPTAQQSKMGTCNKEAGDKKGDERKAFMKECLSAKGGSTAAAAAPAASPACEKSAADKKLHGAAAKSHIKKCMADASPAAPEAAASPACEKSAADKKLHGAAAKSHVKKCMADAASAPKS